MNNEKIIASSAETMERFDPVGAAVGFSAYDGIAVVSRGSVKKYCRVDSVAHFVALTGRPVEEWPWEEMPKFLNFVGSVEHVINSPMLYSRELIEDMISPYPENPIERIISWAGDIGYVWMIPEEWTEA